MLKQNECAEILRLRDSEARWKKWGPYLSERQWGTVREDYSDDGNAWDYFTHDQARSRTYRWGEDGLAGISDDHQILCFALALWNGQDAILKERLFGLTNKEGNHGEDVKECYFYLDSTPTHSYMKYLYKYPQAAYPYCDLINTNKQRSRQEPEYELIDTGVFDQNRYFDVFVEYAKESPEDLLIRISVANRGPDTALLHVLPTLWFRNTWSWEQGSPKPRLEQEDGPEGSVVIAASHSGVGVRYLYGEGTVPLLFTENETNQERVFGSPNVSPYVKDGINDYLVCGRADKVNPGHIGTKACPHYRLEIPGGESRVIRLRLTPIAPGSWGHGAAFGNAFDEVIEARQKEADEFYTSITPDSVNEDAARVMRQALAGMLWSKQFYSYDVDRWTADHSAGSRQGRNREWIHMANEEVIAVPDKWEYPWYSAWDLAFHSAALSIVDLEFAKQQMGLLLRDDFLHPSGQLPASEWNFGDVTPPVQAWAVRFIYEKEKELLGRGDLKYLQEEFQKLSLNFTWWANRRDAHRKSIFDGGFLGLDNLGVIDRNALLLEGGHLEQADGAAWMAFYCQSMLQIAIELAMHDPAFEGMVLTFSRHFALIALALEEMGSEHERMWDEEDGFFYDVLRQPDGRVIRLKVRSLLGLLPLCAATVLHGEIRKHFPNVMRKLSRSLGTHPRMSPWLSLDTAIKDGVGGTRLLGLMDEKNYRRVLSRLLDESEFLGPYGIRSVSRYHLDHPSVFTAGGQEVRVQYSPAESDSGMFGGNTNWRGPVWMPINFMILRSLLNLYEYWGDDFRVECPTGSGRLMNLLEVAREIANRLIRIFLRDENGRRPVHGGAGKFQADPYWRDCVLFYEYFHGDNGAGLGASHQTGWTGTVANMIELFGHCKSADVLAGTAKRGYSRGPDETQS